MQEHIPGKRLVRKGRRSADAGIIQGAGQTDLSFESLIVPMLLLPCLLFIQANAPFSCQGYHLLRMELQTTGEEKNQ
jgi:hypothetical protein